jgi:heptosyltransferase II
VLVVGPSWVGDLVLAEPLLRLLAARCGAVDVLAPAFLAPLLARMAAVRAALPLPFRHGDLRLRARWALGRALRERRYAQAIVLPNSWKSALPVWAARIPRRTGYRGEARWGLLSDRRRLDPAALPRTIARFHALAFPPGVPLPAVPDPQLVATPAQQAATRAALALDPAARPLVLCPGAEYGPAKRWPAHHFAAVARHYLDSGVPVWLLGSARDGPVTGAVNARTHGGCVDLAGRTDLGQACDLLAGARLVVSNDSGLMHVAAALGVPTVGVFGSSDPAHTPPLGARARAVSLALPCSPCFARTCPLGHTRCLEDLAAQRVLDAAAAL